MSREPLVGPGAESGLSFLELLVASSLALTVAFGAYGLVESSRRIASAQERLLEAQASGRAALELLSSDARAAGQSPLQVAVSGVPACSATSVRLVADRDADGIVGGASESGEDLTWLFSGPDPAGRYQLWRGTDLNGDRDFADPGESSDLVLLGVVALDLDLDGVAEPFLACEPAAPATRRVRIAFGVVSPSAPPGAPPAASFRAEAAPRSAR